MNNSDILNYFAYIGTNHIQDSIRNWRNSESDADGWMTKTDWMGRLEFRTSSGDFDGPVIREMMSETGLKEAQVLDLLERAVAEAFDYEIRMIELDAEIAALEAEEA